MRKLGLLVESRLPLFSRWTQESMYNLRPSTCPADTRPPLAVPLGNPGIRTGHLSQEGLNVAMHRFPELVRAVALAAAFHEKHRFTSTGFLAAELPQGATEGPHIDSRDQQLPRCFRMRPQLRRPIKERHVTFVPRIWRRDRLGHAEIRQRGPPAPKIEQHILRFHVQVHKLQLVQVL